MTLPFTRTERTQDLGRIEQLRLATPKRALGTRPGRSRASEAPQNQIAEHRFVHCCEAAVRRAACRLGGTWVTAECHCCSILAMNLLPRHAVSDTRRSLIDAFR